MNKFFFLKKNKNNANKLKKMNESEKNSPGCDDDHNQINSHKICFTL